ncbi:MAG: hypothetical protein ACRC2T_00555 [Thermoguttaceae bacterium]
MPKDKRIILVANCLLNPYCRVHVLGKNFPLTHELTAYLANTRTGVIQYHCPEFTLGGYNRNPQGRQQYDNVFFRKHCQETFATPLKMIEEFVNNGYRLTAFIGLQNSPSCGVHWKKHKENKYGYESWMESPGEASDDEQMGIMTEVIVEGLASIGVEVPLIEFPLSSPIGSPEHQGFWYQVRKAVEPVNPYLTYENAEDFRAYFLTTSHKNDPEAEYVEMRPRKLKQQATETPSK